MSHFYTHNKESINLQDLFKWKEKLNMKSRRLYTTLAKVEDGNTLYNGLVMMLVKIFGYGQMSYGIPQ